jgi:predicted lipoprotein
VILASPCRPAAAFWSLVILLLFVAAPAAAFDHALVAKRTLEAHILPGYVRFDAAAKTFADAASALCRVPSADALTDTRAAAREALLAWGRIEHIRFGPVTESQRLDRLLFYPDPRGFARKQIGRLLKRQDASDLAPDKLAGASVAVQGFTAVDHVLFGKGSDALVDPAGTHSFRCRYGEALAAGIAQIARDTLAAWQGPFQNAWLQPGKGNPAFLTPQETTQALLRDYVTELAVVRLQRLAPVLAQAANSSGHVEPILPRSALGVPFLLADIEGTRNLLTASGFTDPALAANDEERSAMGVLGSVVTDLGFALQSGQSALEVAPDAFANPEARARLAPMSFSLKNAEETGRSAFGTLTGQSLGFNSLDGD